MAFAFDVFANAQTVEQLQHKVATLCPALLHADNCSLMLKTTEHIVDLGLGRKRPIVGLVGQAARTGQRIHILRPQDHPDFDVLIDVSRARCYLCQPLVSRGQVPWLCFVDVWLCLSLCGACVVVVSVAMGQGPPLCLSCPRGMDVDMDVGRGVGTGMQR